MPRMWVRRRRLNGTYYYLCVTGLINTQYVAMLASPPQDDPKLAAATNRINDVLRELEDQKPNSNLLLAFLVIDDELVLAWVYEVDTDIADVADITEEELLVEPLDSTEPHAHA
jgi:hypothetical protein